VSVMTPEQARADLARLQGKGLDNVLKNAMRRGARRVREESIKDISRKGLGRRIWGKKPKGLRKQVVAGKVEKASPAGFSVEITVKGLPGMMELGGRTEAHDIKARKAGPKGKRLLSFRASGGEGAVAEVRHPGSNIHKDPSVEPNLAKHSPQIERDITAAVDVFAGI
jgi:hypothetical protein